MKRDILFRCSSIGKLMTEPKTKAEGPLSVGAKTYIRTLVAEELFGIDFEVSSKPMEKGIRMEGEAIQLLNRVRGFDLVKNTERRSNEWIKGEADLFNVSSLRGHDLKCSWSVATFPIVTQDCIDKLYEYQMRGYMMLWGAKEWEVNYALLSTPEDLCKWEPQTMHFVDHIPEHMRLTSWTVEHCPDKEAAMIEKIKHAREYYLQVVEEFERTHQCKPLTYS